MQFWKIVKQAAVLLALFLAAIQVWDWFGKPSQRLEAEVSYGAFEMPPSVDVLLRLNQELPSGDWLPTSIAKALSDAEVPLKDVPRLSSRVTWAVRDGLRENLPFQLPPSVTGLQGLWRVTVRNGGSQPLQAVRLVLPFSSLAIIEREGAKPIQRELDSNVDLEIIHPGEVVRVTAWAKLKPMRPSDEDVRLSHSNGVGSVSFRHTAGSVGQFADKYWVPIVLVLPWVVVVLLLQVFTRHAPRTRAGSEDIRSSERPGNDG